MKIQDMTLADLHQGLKDFKAMKTMVEVSEAELLQAVRERGLAGEAVFMAEPYMKLFRNDAGEVVATVIFSDPRLCFLRK